MYFFLLKNTLFKQDFFLLVYFYPRGFFLNSVDVGCFGIVQTDVKRAFRFFSKRFLLPYRKRRFLFKRKRVFMKRRARRLHKKQSVLPHNSFEFISQLVMHTDNYVFMSFFFKTFSFLKESYYRFFLHSQKQQLPIIYQLAFQMFLKFFFRQKIRLRFFDTTSAIQSNFLQMSLHFVQKELRGKNRFLYLIEVVDILLVALHQKNAPLFLWWIKKTFESWDFKRFNLLFLFLKVILGYAEFHILKLFFLRGVFIKFKGKLQKGASRKRKRLFQFGTTSLTSKNLRLSAACCQIRTLSGSIGCNLRIFY